MSEIPLFPEESIQGVVDGITYSNEENGYMVARLLENGTQKKHTIVGKMPGVQVGESLEVSGIWTTHAQFGRQLEVKRYRIRPPQTVEAIRRYLSSGLIRGVGQVTAERITDQFGVETLNILDEHPERLVEVKKIGRKRAQQIAAAWQEQKQLKDVMMFLQQYGVGVALGIKIFKQYGETTMQVVRRDPYQLVRDISGVGFLTADRIALETGMSREAPARVRAGLVYTLETMSQEGHCFAPLEVLVDECVKLLQLPHESCAEQAAILLQRGLLVGTTEAVYLPYLHQSEVQTAERLAQMAREPKDRLGIFAGMDWAAAEAWLNGAVKIELTREQLDAIRMAITNKVSILTGGPGTGKSTITGSLIQLVTSFGRSVQLAAPTGRAARRLTEATGMEALTIHRLLEYSPSSNNFQRNRKHPINTDMLIIDETSMVDILLMHSLLDAVPDDTHLLFIGDADQLPSVGPGNVLRDMINSQKIPVQRLNRIFRQSENSYITENAQRIHRGEPPFFAKDAEDFFLFKAENPQDAENWIVDIVTRRLGVRFGLHPEDVQVLSPMYRGPAGVNALNQRLQEALNPKRRDRQEVQSGERLLRGGDRVMQIRNNYDKGVYNGDIGKVARIQTEDQWLEVKFEDRVVQYEFTQLDELQLAYAVSIHKSQGNEFPVVVLPLLTSHFIMLQRNLIYTAITRAKKIVVLVGSPRAIAIAVKNNQTAERNTGLAARLQSIFT